MLLRPKTKRRVALLLALVTVIGAGAATAYVARARQVERELLVTRNEGLKALEAGDHFIAMHKIGRYAQRHPDDVETMYAYARARRGVPMEGSKHLLQAVGILTRVISQAPEHLAARRDRVELLAELGYNAETLQAADELLERDPDDLVALRSKTMALAGLGRPEEALVIAAKRNELLPMDVRFRQLTLTLMREAKATPQQLTEYAQAIRTRYPGDARSDLLVAVAHLQAGNGQEYVNWLKTAVTHDEAADPDFVELLASHLDYAGMYQDSLELMDRASAENRNPRLTTLLADRWFQLKRWRDLSDRLASINPAAPESSSHLLALRAACLTQEKRHEEALLIIAALSARKDDAVATAWSRVIPIVFAEGGSPGARERLDALEDAIQRVPSSPYFTQWLAETYAVLGESELSLQLWRDAADRAPAWATPHEQIARTLLAMNRAREAAVSMREALQRSPDDPEVLSTVTLFAAAEISPQSEATFDGATALLEKITQLDPDRRDIEAVRVLYLIRAGHREDAKAAMEAILNAPAGVPEQGLLALAEMSARLGFGLEGLCYQRVRKQYGTTAQLVARLAEVELRAGRGDAGKAIIEQALKDASAEEAAGIRLELARYLEKSRDPMAGPIWVAVADAAAGDTTVQWEAFYAPSTRPDREARGRMIARLEERIGRRGAGWRVARALWTLEAKPDESEIVRTAASLGEVVRITPQYVRARALLAECLLLLKNEKTAIAQLAQAAESNPDIHEVALRLCELLIESNELTRAGVYARRVVESRTASPDLRAAAASMLAQTGDLSAATASLQHELRIRPANNKARLNLAQLYARRGEPVDELLKEMLVAPDEPAVRFALGHYLRMGQTEQAAELIGRLEALAIPAPSQALIRAEYLSATGHPAEAEEQLKRATEIGPELFATWQGLMLHYAQQRQIEQLLTALAQAKSRLPEDRMIALLHAEQEALRKAAANSLAQPLITAMVRAPEQAPVLGKALVALSTSDATSTGRRALTEQLRDIAEHNPRLVPLHMVLAQAYLAGQQRDEAAQIANRLLSAFPDDPGVAQSACGILAAAGKWDQLLVAGRQWAGLYPGPQIGADMALARAHMGLGQPARALKQLEPHLRRVSAGDQSIDLLCLAAGAQASMKNVNEAEAILSPLLGSHKAARSTWAGLAAETLQDHELAANWLRRLSEVTPADFEEQIRVAHAWYRLAERSGNDSHGGQLKQQLATISAIDGIEQQLTADQAELLGTLCHMASDLASAERFYRRALELSPDLPATANNMAMVILTNGGDPAEAVTYARRAVELRPNAAGFHDTLGLALSRQAKHEEAAKSLARAVELEPRNESFAVTLASALMDANKPEQARATLDRLQAQGADFSQLPEEQQKQLQQIRARFDQ